ncbi:MAG: type II toxin-antitoxin system PemK/MazF family toxin [Candidatus Gracilibacteria bacterium]|nr:type II toxin-antitoxin system PemK/MazF family toxin [Candidatus Gracilibacteria bacterium]
MYNIGDIVMINFPFSDFTNFKLRPVLIWENLGNDIIVMPITSNNINSFGEYLLVKNNFNNLKIDSYLKPFNINTVDKNIIVGKLGKISKEDLQNISKLFCSKFCKKEL